MVIKLQTFKTKKFLKKALIIDSNHVCIIVISLECVLQKDENYCLQVFLKECKYIEKEKSCLACY